MASLTSAFLVPSADAATNNPPPSQLAGLTLRPAHAHTTARDKEATRVDEQAYVLGPASDTTRCLDADTNTINSNGTTVRLWTCNLDAPQQSWYIEPIPEGYYRLKNAANGRYLDADLNTIDRDGTIVQLWDYIAGADNQWFAITTIPEGYQRMQNVHNGRYLDADANTSNTNGTIVQLWSYTAGATNQWWF